ncbi:MAG: metallopeptidase family protein [Elusimicrobia bacterium]|nr:metallopeptidase family protein [Elusimicrobiota bacterium]
MDMDEFEKVVNDSVDKIPEKFRVVLEKENIKLLAREKATDVLQNKFRNNLIFGVFIGVSHTKRSVFNIQQEPTRIELYKESFEKAFGSGQEIEKQIIKTVVHEIGHYFGFSEEELRAYL